MMGLSWTKVLSAIFLLSATPIGVCSAAIRSDSLQSISHSKRATFWQPVAGTSWQIVLLDEVQDLSLDVSVYDIDLFTNPASTIDTLHQNGQKVICYFSAGTYENFRPDSSKFTSSDYGKPLPEWPGEWWADTRSDNVRRIMVERLDLAASKGCDGVDPDNMDGYGNDNGLGLTEDDAVDYINFLAAAAHDRGMAMGLKNAASIIPRVLDSMQWAINEQCVSYNECADTRPFIDAGKPVFSIEYPSSAPNLDQQTEDTICGDPQRAGFSTLLKEMKLSEWFYACPGDIPFVSKTPPKNGTSPSTSPSNSTSGSSSTAPAATPASSVSSQTAISTSSATALSAPSSVSNVVYMLMAFLAVTLTTP